MIMDAVIDMLSPSEFEFEMPLLRPVRIPTKGLKWYQRFFKHFERRRWELAEDYLLYVPWLEMTLRIPKGFIFDGASVPRIFWPLINPTGILLIGSIFHDFGYKYNCLLDKDMKIVYNKAGKAFMDKLFKDLNIHVNQVHSMNTVAWLALAGFGVFSWGGHRKTNRDVREDYKDARSEAAQKLWAERQNNKI